MHVNVDMHWRCHRRLYEHMEHAVDIKVDDIQVNMGIYVKNMCKNHYKTQICCHNKVFIHFHNMLQLESTNPT